MASRPRADRRLRPASHNGHPTDAPPAAPPTPAVSVVVPVWNEAEVLPAFHARLVAVLDGLGRPAEVVYVDDGSADRSLPLLRERAAVDRRVRVLVFNRNYGQHAAVFAGLAAARGRTCVTLDADLQNPPEEIPRLLARADEGYDVVAGWRQDRQDSAFRRGASRLANRLMVRAIGVPLHDYGCMLRAYSREVVDALARCDERSSFLPALACRFARRVAEVPVAHAARAAGRSKYSLWRLLKLQADLMTGFSVLPLRLATFLGLTVALLALGFGVFLGIRRLVVGPEEGGVFTLFAILFFLTGGQFLAMGILGEYVARIYDEVRARPRALVRERIGFDDAAAPAAPAHP